MAKPVSDIAQSREKAIIARKQQQAESRQQIAAKAVPLLALFIANVIFVSMDIRGYMAVLSITQNAVLAAATVIVSGILALVWWDFMFPHGRKHSNQVQINLSLVGAGVGIMLSAVLAFIDYIVGNTQINQNLLWGFVIIATAGQGILLAWWWLIDNGIEAEAKRLRSLTGRTDIANDFEDFQAELKSMSDLALKMEELKKQYGGARNAAKAAKAMGWTVLAEMLSDDDNDGIPNYQDRDWKPKMRPAMASDAPRVDMPTKVAPFRPEPPDEDEPKN